MKTISIKRYKDAEHHVAPWGVCYYANGKRVLSFHPTKRAAMERKKELQKLFRSGLDPKEIEQASRLLAGTAISLSSAVGAGIAALAKQFGCNATAPLAAGGKIVIDRAIKSGADPRTIQNYRSIYRTIDKAFHQRIATTVTNDEVQDFIDKLPDRYGVVGKASPFTKRRFLTLLQMAFKALGFKRAFADIAYRRDYTREVAFYTPEQVKTMFASTPPNERGLLALAVFAAMRPELLSKLPAECVDVEQRCIVIPAYLAKDRRPHRLEGEWERPDGKIIPGLPNILWDWLRAYPYHPGNWESLQVRLKRALGGFWIQDGPRHTGATYYYKCFGESETGKLLTHEGVHLVLEHYVGVTSPKDAAAFYAISPTNVVFKVFSAKNTALKINWPPHARLAQMLLAKTAREVVRELACTEGALLLHCKKFGIPKPSWGYWAKVRANKPAVPRQLGKAKKKDHGKDSEDRAAAG